MLSRFTLKLVSVISVVGIVSGCQEPHDGHARLEEATASDSASISSASNDNHYFSESENGLYRAEIWPVSGKIDIGKLHSWQLRIGNANEQPVSDLRVEIGGGMKGHGHGLPTQPRLTKALGNSEFLMEGFRFNMDGLWTISLQVGSSSGVDRLNFQIQVDY